MYALTPTFPNNQQEWYSTSTMEYPWLSQVDSFSPTLPSFLYPSFDQSDDTKNYYNINLHPHHMNLPHINGSNNNYNQEAGRVSVLEKKLNHNASERGRRRKLNALFSSLRALLPPMYHKKLSIPKTVVAVLKYIPEQKQELESLSRRKEELLKIISIKTAALKHQQEQLRNRAMMDSSVDYSSQKITASWITDTEIAVQIGTSKWSSISDMLLRLEENGLNVISTSSSVSSTARIFYTLHLQMRGDCRARLEELDYMLFGLNQSY